MKLVYLLYSTYSLNLIIYYLAVMDNIPYQQQQNQMQFQILPTLSPEEQLRMQQEYQKKLQGFYGKNKKYQIDYWYPAIKQFTFKSFSFPLTNIEAYVLHALYYEQQMTEQIQQVKSKLISKIDALLIQHKSASNNGRYFMKLSTRSPKDYCWDYRDPKQFKKGVENLKMFLESQKVNKQTTSQKLNNVLYKFFLINSHQKLMIGSGEDFIRIFSKSERIITDINDYSYLNDRVFEKIKQKTLSQERKHEKLINVWVRDWEDCQWQQQFRTFYNNYKLTGISQYDQRCYFAELPLKKDFIAKACLECFEKVKPGLQSINLQKGVIDFIVKQDQVKIVQINVFDGDARASLFNWTEDQQILLNGPLQIRILQKQIQIPRVYLGSIMGMIDKRSTDVILQVLQQMGITQLWK